MKWCLLLIYLLRLKEEDNKQISLNIEFKLFVRTDKIIIYKIKISNFKRLDWFCFKILLLLFIFLSLLRNKSFCPRIRFKKNIFKKIFLILKFSSKKWFLSLFQYSYNKSYSWSDKESYKRTCIVLNYFSGLYSIFFASYTSLVCG